MKILEFTVVLIRLLAVIPVLAAIYLLPNALLMASFDDPQIEEGFSYYFFLVPSISFMIGGIVTWACATPLARFMIPKSARASDAPTIDLATVERVGFALIGVYTLSWSIPELIRVGVIRWSNAEQPLVSVAAVDPYQDIATMASTMVGLALVFGAKGLQSLLRKIRYYGA